MVLGNSIFYLLVGGSVLGLNVPPSELRGQWMHISIGSGFVKPYAV